MPVRSKYTFAAKGFARKDREFDFSAGKPHVNGVIKK
jgi:hypothetical protein